MLNFAKSVRFVRVLGLILIALGTLAMPLGANAASDQSRSQPSTVLVQGQILREGFPALYEVPNGINGSFGLGGKTIYFETRRGPRTPKYLRGGDPTTPDYEIDVRFMDQDGRPFLTQIGGDALLDSTWVEPVPKPKVDEEINTDFELADKAIGALKKLKFKQKFVHERRALLNLAQIMESAQVIEKIEGAPSQPLSSQTLAVANTYRHKVEIHHKSCCLGLGRHSGTIGKYISNTGVVTTAVITCNHGTCADQMALKCSWYSAYPGNRTTKLNNDITCSTPYNATSVFGHNSNDDTDLQYRAVRTNSRPSTSGGICNDSSTNNEPTNCY